MEKIMLGDFIYRMRKEKGYSQSELGQLVGVSNKAVSKWETFEANPDLDIIKKLAQVLGVSADELLDCKKSEVGKEQGESQENSSIFSTLGIKGKVTREPGHYEFKSFAATKKGTPIIHINMGRDKNGKTCRAKGIFALGNISVGIVSIGFINIGLIGMGLISISLVAIGLISIGLFTAVGGIAVGLGVSVGGVAVGAIAVGGIAVGILSIGGISVGVFAHTGINGIAYGFKTIYHK